MRFAFLLTGLLLTSAACRAQHDTVDLHLEGLLVDDGLPQGYVLGIAQDSLGYMWFGGNDGLARYDGYGFTVFQHDPQDSNSIGGLRVHSLHVDPSGYLWIGFSPFGIDRYDPRTGRFAHVVVEGVEVKEAEGSILGICSDKLGRVWMTTATRAWVVDPARDGPPRLLDPRELQPPVQPLRRAQLYMGPNGDPWFSSPDTIRCVHYTDDGGVQLVDRPHRIPWVWDDGVRLRPELVPEVQSGSMLVMEPGLITRMVAGRADPVDTLRLPMNDFRKVIADRHGRLWCDQPYEPDMRFTMATGRMERITYSGSETEAERTPYGGFGAFFEDRAGTLWVQSNGFGVFHTNTRNERFKKMDRGELYGVYPGKLDGSVLLGYTSQGPVHRFRASDPRSGALVQRSADEWFTNRAAVDDRGRLWIGQVETGTRRITAVVWDKGRMTKIPALANERVRDVLPGEANTVWMVTTLEDDLVTGLVHLDMHTGGIIRRYTPPQGHALRHNHAIGNMVFLPNGQIWMATVDGLHHIDPTTGTWTAHRHSEDDPHSLPDDFLLAVCKDPDDPDHVLWVGSHGGLTRVDLHMADNSGEVIRFTTFTTKDGLPNNAVCSILSDARHNLWLGTSQGLCHYFPRSGRVVQYTKEHGLPSLEFNRLAFAKASDGELWFEGMGGAFHFNPEEFYDSIPASPTVITGLKLVGRPVAVAGLGNATGQGYELPAPIEHVRSITLPYSERMLTFSFACMDHHAPLKNTFRYILEGFSEDWVDVGTVHEATFTNLDPGTYTFRVQGRNSAGVWDERGATMELIITPPWWGTWWFRIAALLAFAGVLYAFYRYRLAQAVKVVRVRERIARDLHDEIGSTLSSVSLFSSVAQMKAVGKAPEASELLGRIAESTTQVLESMNDIVWAVNADNDDMASVIKRMFAFAVSVTEAQGCKLHLQADEVVKGWRLEMTQRKNLYLVFKEAVNNAMKYAGCTNLRVELQRDRSAIVLRVTDDGKGFDPSAHNGSVGGGNGLGNMRNRAAEIPGTLTITSSPGKGTTVELRFVPGEGKRSLETMTPGAA